MNDPGKVKRKFSSFFKSLVIELDKDLYGPDNHLVEVPVVSRSIRSYIAVIERPSKLMSCVSFLWSSPKLAETLLLCT